MKVAILTLATTTLLGAGLVFAQRPANPSGSSSGSAGSNPGTAAGTFGGSTRGTYGTPTTRTPSSQIERPIFLSGKVLFDDGAPPNGNIRIERVCGGNPIPETHTDMRGNFSFQVGQNLAADMDASSSAAPAGAFGSRRVDDGSGLTSRLGGGGSDAERRLWNCDLRASYPGYSSDTVRLAGRHSLDQPDVGVIVLHRLGKAEGTTISVTTALAPKDAQKAYKKGLQAVERNKLEEAQKHFEEAVSLYPKYALAWYSLGQLQQKGGKAQDARSSYQAAVKADSHYVNPYDRLAYMAAQAGNWEEAAQLSKQAISLNPVEFPSSFWYNAIANYQLKQQADAAKSTRDLLKLDTQNNFPQAESMMAELLLSEGKNAEAAGHLRSYLKLMPNAENADAVKRLLQKLTDENQVSKASQPPSQPRQ